MISKVFSGHSFYHACRYVVNKPGASVLECEGVRGHDYRAMSDDFIMQQQLRPEKEKACFHCALSFYPGEILSDDVMAKIAKEYLQKLKIVNTQFAITKHTDRKHIHLHVVANLVDNNGNAISDSYLGLRGKKTAQQLTQEYQLVPAVGKNLNLTNYEALTESEADKYKIYEAIMKALPQFQSMEELQNRLKLKGIETQYKYKGQTLENQGVSFKLGENCFKGSKIDRKFSLGNLEKTFLTNQKQTVHLKPKAEQNSTIQSIQAQQNKQLTSFITPNEESGKIVEGLEKVVDTLFTPKENAASTPYELLKENRRKRKQSKKRGLHH